MLVAACFSPLLSGFSPSRVAQTVDATAAHGLAPIRAYISDGWNKLSRSLADCSTYEDPKLKSQPQLYLPSDFPISGKIRALESRCGLHAVNLPSNASRIGQPGVEKLQPAGLLYLDNPYVVPGGRFNEMYGWDSYFIILGLLRDGRRDLAKDMVNNFPFRGAALRRGSQCQSHLLPDALPAPVSNLDDSRRL